MSFPARRCECKNVRGLFFIGEVVDVTGHLGGFNFPVGVGLGRSGWASDLSFDSDCSFQLSFEFAQRA